MGKLILGVVVVVGVMGLNTVAEPQLEGATISGTVKGPAGNGLSGVLVRLIQKDRGITTSVVTQTEGRYEAKSLFPGTYEVLAERTGFETAARGNIDVDTSSSPSIDLVLNRQKTEKVQLTPADVYAQFPEDPDKTLVIHACFRCHSMGDLVRARKDREGWQRTINIMARRRFGDGLTPEISERLVNYFSKYFHPRRPAPPALERRVEPPVKGPTVTIREYVIPDQGQNPAPHIFSEYGTSSMRRPEHVFPHNISVDPKGIVWFAMYQANNIGRLDPTTGQFRSFPVETPASVPHGITFAEDGSIWFTEFRGKKVGHLDPETGKIAEILMNAGGNTIAGDSKGNMYLTMYESNQIGKVDTRTGETTTYDLLTPSAHPYGLTVDQKDQVWWCQLHADSIGRLDPTTGKITEYPTPTPYSGPRRLTVDQNGEIWFTEWMANKLGRLDPVTGKITEYELPTPHSEPYVVEVDREDNVWVAGYLSNTLALFDRNSGTFTEYPIPTPGAQIRKMATDPEQGVWFAESYTDVVGHIVLER